MLLIILLFLVFVALAIVGFGYLLPLVVKQLAEKDTFWTTVPPPGKYKFLMKGGRLVAVLENVVLWQLDKNYRFVRGERRKSLSEIWFGAIWMGISPLYRIEEFADRQWTELKMIAGGDQEAPQYAVVARKKDKVTEFLFQFTVIIPVLGMELTGNIQANVNALLTVLILDPVKAFFTNKNWLEVMAGMVQSVIRGRATGLSFDQLKKITQNSGPGSDFEVILKAINGIFLGPTDPAYSAADPNMLFGITGVAIWAASLQDLEATGDAAIALRAKEVATLKGEAEVAAATKRAEALVEDARGRFNSAELDAAAQRMVLEQTAGYLASLPGGDRMYVAHRLASTESDVTTWAEAGAEVRPSLALPLAPHPVVPRK